MHSLFVHLSLRLGSAEAKMCPRVEFKLMDLESVGNLAFLVLHLRCCGKAVILNKLVLRSYAQWLFPGWHPETAVILGQFCRWRANFGSRAGGDCLKKWRKGVELCSWFQRMQKGVCHNDKECRTLWKFNSCEMQFQLICRQENLTFQ